MTDSPFQHLATYAEKPRILNAVIETPKGTRNRYKYEPSLGLFILEDILSSGLVYPCDYGFLPATLGEDGDPLDVVVFIEQPTFCGCVIPARLIGVLEAKQTERDGRVVRNDRFLAVPSGSPDQGEIAQPGDLPRGVIDEINRFFVNNEAAKGKQYHPLGEAGPQRAIELIEAGIQAYQKSRQVGEEYRA